MTDQRPTPDAILAYVQLLRLTDQLLVIADALRVGYGPELNNGSVQTAVTVDENLEAVLWKGTHASNTMTVRGVAAPAGEGDR